MDLSFLLIFWVLCTLHWKVIQLGNVWEVRKVGTCQGALLLPFLRGGNDSADGCVQIGARPFYPTSGGAVKPPSSGSGAESPSGEAERKVGKSVAAER